MKLRSNRAVLAALAFVIAAAPQVSATDSMIAPDSGNYTADRVSMSAATAIGDSSASYRMNWSAGEVAVGDGESPSYQLSIGFWSACDCPLQADFDANGSLDALDLNALIDALFFAGANPQDSGCPTTRGDFNNDGAPDALDLNDLIDHLFFGGSPPVNPCAP